MCESVVPRSFQRSRSAPRVTFSHGVEDFSSRSRYNQHQVRLSPTMCNTTMTSPRSVIRNVTNLPCIAGQRNSNLSSGSVSEDTRSPLPSDFCPFLPAALQPREHLSLWYATYANQRREQSLRQQQQQQQQRRVDQPSSSSASLLAVSLVSSLSTSESVHLADQASSAIPLTVACDDDDVWIGGHPSAASCNAISPRRYCNHDSPPPPQQQTPNSLNVIVACGGKQAFIRAIQEIYSPSSPIPSPPTSGTGGRGKKQQEVSSEATKLV